MSEEINETKSVKKLERNSPQELAAASPDGLNLQASLAFSLIGTRLTASFSKIGDKKIFLVIPVDEKPNDGMSIRDMVNQVNEMIKGYGDTSTSIDAGAIEQGVSDVAEAGKKKGANDLALDPKSIKVCLKQAFLLFSSGESVEYALQITIDAGEVFPKGQSFFNVETLSFCVWNTDRAKILSRMDIVNIEKYLADNT